MILIAKADVNICQGWRRRVSKSELDLLTESDLASVRLIIDRIKTYYPRHAILAEESGTNPPAAAGYQSDWRWIIDRSTSLRRQFSPATV